MSALRWCVECTNERGRTPRWLWVSWFDHRRPALAEVQRQLRLQRMLDIGSDVRWRVSRWERI